MKISKSFTTQFRSYLDPTICQRCNKARISTLLFCNDCHDDIYIESTMRNLVQLDERKLPDGMHIVTRRGLALQNKRAMDFDNFDDME